MCSAPTSFVPSMSTMCPLFPSLSGSSPLKTRPFHRAFFKVGVAFGSKTHD
uniref:Uncharacterized protein n=1 Tax=Caenorhabditis japonica TaxID=281687 RepID=A0A8R1EA15_CAEJA